MGPQPTRPLEMLAQEEGGSVGRVVLCAHRWRVRAPVQTRVGTPTAVSVSLSLSTRLSVRIKNTKTKPFLHVQMLPHTHMRIHKASCHLADAAAVPEPRPGRRPVQAPRCVEGGGHHGLSFMKERLKDPVFPDPLFLPLQLLYCSASEMQFRGRRPCVQRRVGETPLLGQWWLQSRRGGGSEKMRPSSPSCEGHRHFSVRRT